MEIWPTVLPAKLDENHVLLLDDWSDSKDTKVRAVRAV